METAKIFMNGKSQAVRLPKSCRFNCEEVSIKKVGDIVLLYRADKALENFLQSEPITDDVLSAILDARKEDSRHAANHPDNREQI